MYEDFGAAVSGRSVQFRLFFPDADKDPGQYQTGGGPPRIARLRVVGDFQSSIGGDDWDFEHAPEMTLDDHRQGNLYTYDIDGLPEGFYQYKYFVTFENGESRWCGDPCAKYVAGRNENAGFVVGGSTVASIIDPIGRRLPQGDLIIYEMMLDDFTAEYRDGRSAMDAAGEKLDYLEELGVNAVQMMPWTAWPGGSFSWGYDPFLFFAAEDRYLRDDSDPGSPDRLYRLARLIHVLHDRGMHVIMDGVFNHVTAGPGPGRGFPYFWLYQEPDESPFIGSFGPGGYFLELDYHNACTQQFVADACNYWIDRFQIDGIRFDYTLGFHDHNNRDRGITKLVDDVKGNLDTPPKEENFALMLEHLTDNRYQAIDDTNRICASGCWYDRFLYDVPSYGFNGGVDGRLLRVLHTSRDFNPGKGPVTYIENHDHSTVVSRAGGRGNWWKTQCPLIALMTSPGAVLLHNGQEFGDDYWLPSSGSGRVSPRPVHWDFLQDGVGQGMFALYRRLIQLRKDHPALRSANFYPHEYDDNDTRFRQDGFGVDSSRGVVIYHRWGPARDGRLERFVVALNFSRWATYVDVPVSLNGEWEDLLNGGDWHAHDCWLRSTRVESNWGRVFYHKE